MAAPASRVSRVSMAGPLAAFAEAYSAELRERGYRPLSIVNELRQVGRLSRWLEADGLSVADLSGGRVEQFLAWQRAGGRHRCQWSRPGLACLLEVLRGLGVLTAEDAVAAGSPADLFLASFERFLVAERGLAVGTASGYVKHARRFLDGLAAGCGLAGLAASDVTGAVLRDAGSGLSVSATQYFVSGLRAFLRFCFIEGLVEADLSQAAYLQTIDPTTEVPPADVLAVRYQRPAPYLWSDADICRLLEATRALRPPLKAASYEALFGLLAVSGMRVGEAVALQSGDVDLDDGVITIREQVAKLERARLVPLHPTTADALGRYGTQRERLCPKPSSRAFFLSGTGAALDRSAVSKTLRKITAALGLRTATVHPRAHDLRHSFAVRTLIDWQRSGVQIDDRIAALSTYLGHVSPAETYWYLTATPELMGLAAQRLNTRFGARS